mmetsp:Transcript_6924/g.42258  ORF Transcript_6924/g.42258 Transcript_6924/m.42258 type:complete len:131 (+) Transcript_6924:6016-6408(+)
MACDTSRPGAPCVRAWPRVRVRRSTSSRRSEETRATCTCRNETKRSDVATFVSKHVLRRRRCTSATRERSVVGSHVVAPVAQPGDAVAQTQDVEVGRARGAQRAHVASDAEEFARAPQLQAFGLLSYQRR